VYTTEGVKKGVKKGVEEGVASALLTVHNNVHVNTSSPAVKQKAPKIQRHSISRGSTKETWNSFCARWNMFRQGTALNLTEVCQQLFSCYDDELGNDLLRNNTNILQSTEQDLLTAIKSLAVTLVAVSVPRADLLALHQSDGENVISFYARIRAKAETCAYNIKCSSATCTQTVDFTDVITKTS